MSASDQAEGLRRLLRASACRIVAVAGLSPDVGATTVAMNIAAAVAGGGKPVLFIDEHPGGPRSAHRRWPGALAGELTDVAARRTPFAAAAPSIGPALRVLRAAPAAGFGSFNPRSLCPDGLIVVDLALGGTGLLSPLGRMADELLLVLQPSAASITASYAGLKRLQYAHALQSFKFVVNQATDARQARQVADNIVATAARHLAVSLQWAGWVAADALMGEAAAQMDTICHRRPQADAAGQLRAIAAALLGANRSQQGAPSAGAGDADHASACGYTPAAA